MSYYIMLYYIIFYYIILYYMLLYAIIVCSSCCDMFHVIDEADLKAATEIREKESGVAKWGKASGGNRKV